MMLLGIASIGVSVGFFRLAGFGVDPFTCMNLGISTYLGWSFGNWQLLCNILILTVVFFAMRGLIGLGTLCNMVLVGYLADFVCFLAEEALGLEPALAGRAALLLLALLFLSLGAALYMKADMGIGPYDSVGLIIEKLSKGRIRYHIARILSDAAVVAVGVAFCLLTGRQVWYVIGLGTVANALLNGPMIQMFRNMLDRSTDKPLEK